MRKWEAVQQKTTTVLEDKPLDRRLQPSARLKWLMGQEIELAQRHPP